MQHSELISSYVDTVNEFDIGARAKCLSTMRLRELMIDTIVFQDVMESKELDAAYQQLAFAIDHPEDISERIHIANSHVNDRMDELWNALRFKAPSRELIIGRHFLDICDEQLKEGFS